MILHKEFYKRDALIVAEELLGKILVRKIDGIIIKSKIVETEAYIGAIDKASHAYNNKRTARTEPLFHEGGITYVYFIYGLYYCFNVISDEKDVASGVLIRAVEPLDNFDYLAKVRFNKKYDELTKVQRRNLTNGPGKICMALSINKDENYKKLYLPKDLYIEDNTKKDFDVIKTTRIGIDYAEEAREFPWRFYIKGNMYISKK